MAAKNLFHQFVEALGVPHTSAFTDRVFETHPYKYTLYGIARMLREYGIQVTGIQLADKEKLADIGVPFIAQVSNDLVVVRGADQSSVAYDWYGERVRTGRAEFCAAWSGAALLAMPDENSREPEYRKHRLAALLEQTKRHVPELSLLLVFGCLLAAGYRPGRLQLAAAAGYAAGGWLSYLLLLQQLHIRGTLSDRACHLSKQNSCRNVLDSPAARIPGGFTWSEAGLAFFTTSAAAALCFPPSLPVLAILNACALGYVCWSVWYQKFRAGAWCPLCLSVQAVLVGVFLLFLCGGSYASPDISPIPAIIMTAGYASALSVINRLSALKAKAEKARAREQAYENLKLRKEVFEPLLRKQPAYPSDDAASHLLFGSPEATHTVTVFSNPFCNPCAAMHRRLHALPGRKCNVRYILTSFNEKLAFANERLIAAYLHAGPDRAWEIFDRWYDDGKTTPDSFFEAEHIPPAGPPVAEEMERHRKWKEATKLAATPTVLFDGHVLPQPYTVEDLIHFVS